MTAMYVHLVRSIKKYCACLRATVGPDIMVFPILVRSCMMNGLWCTRIHCCIGVLLAMIHDTAI